MKHRFQFLLAFVFAVIGLEKAHASNVVLSWDASSSPQAAGYYVYYGTTSGIYSYRVNAGNATSVTLPNLIPGATYYISATSYDASGNQSSFSGEVSFTAPVDSSGTVSLSAVSASGSGPAGAGSLQFPASSGHSYEIQATTDFVNWTSIWQSGAISSNTLLQFTDPDAASFAARFYRLVIH